MATISTASVGNYKVYISVGVSTNPSTKKTTLTCRAFLDGGSSSGTSATLGVVSANVSAVNGSVDTTYVSFSSGGTFVAGSQIGSAKTIIITHNSSGKGSCKITLNARINGTGVSSSATTISGDNITVYTSCTAPTSVSASPAIVAPGGTISISWSGAGAGTNNPIKGYKVYYTTNGNTPTTSSSSISATSSPATLTAGTTDATVYKFGVVALGDHGNSGIKVGGSSKVNTAPGKPTVSADKTVLPAAGGSVKFTLTAGSDSDSQTCTIRYRKDNTAPTTSNTTVITSGTSINVTATTTFYFYTYDGLEFSGAQTITITVNAVPTLTTATISPATLVSTGGTVTFTLAGNANTGGTLSFRYKTASGDPTTSNTTAITNGATKTVTVTTTFYIYAYDGYDFSAAKTATVTVIPRPTISSVTVSPTIIAKDTSTTVTYTIKTGSSYNSKVFYSTSSASPATTWPSIAASGATTVTFSTSLSATATYYFWAYNTKGEFSAAGTSKAVTLNTPPSKPTVSPASTIAIAGTTVYLTPTAGADSNSGQTLSVYYASTTNGTKTKLTTTSLAVGVPATQGNSVNRYFWTYDGLNYSTSYTTATIIANTRPSPPTVSVSPAIVVPGGNVKFTVTAGTDPDSSQTRTIHYSTASNSSTPSSFTSPLSVTATTATASRGSTFTYYFWTKDGLQFSSSAKSSSYKINSLPPAPSATTNVVVISSTATSCHPTVNAGTDTTDGQTLTVYYGTTAAGATTKYTSTVNLAPSSGVATYYFKNHDTLEYGTGTTSVTIKRNIAPTLTSLTGSGGFITVNGTNYFPAAGGATIAFTIKGSNTNYNNINAYYYRWDYISTSTILSTSATTTTVNVTSPSYSTSGLPTTKQIYFRASAYDGLDYSTVLTAGPYTVNSAPNKPSWVSASDFIVANSGDSATFELKAGNANSGASALSVAYSTSTTAARTTLPTNNKITLGTGTYFFWTHDGVDYSTTYVTGTISTLGTWGATVSNYSASTYSALGTSTSSGNFLGWANSMSLVMKNSATPACKAEVKAYLVNKDTPSSILVTVDLPDISIPASTNSTASVNYDIYSILTTVPTLSNILDSTSVGWKFSITPYIVDSNGVKSTKSTIYVPSTTATGSTTDSSKYYAIPRAPSMTVSSNIHNASYTTNYSNSNYSTQADNSLYFGKYLYINFPYDERANSAIIKFYIGSQSYTVATASVIAPDSDSSQGHFRLDFDGGISTFTNAMREQDQTISLEIKLQEGTKTGTAKKINISEDLSLKWLRTLKEITGWNLSGIDNHNPYYNSITNYPYMDFNYADLVSSSFTGTTWDSIKTDLMSKRFINSFTFLIYENDTLSSLPNSIDTSKGSILTTLIGASASNPNTIDTTNKIIKLIDNSSTHPMLNNLFNYTAFASSGFMGLTPSNAFNKTTKTFYLYNIYGDVFGRWNVRSSKKSYLIQDTYSLSLLLKYKSKGSETYNGTYDSSKYLQGDQPVEITGTLQHKAAVNTTSLKFNLSKKINNTTISVDTPTLSGNDEGSTTNTYKTKVLTSSTDIIDFIKSDSITYILKSTNLAAAENFSVQQAYNVRPQYAPEDFQINSITIIKDDNGDYNLRLNYNCKYADFPSDATNFTTSDLKVVKFDSATGETIQLNDCLVSGNTLPKQVLNQETENQLVSSFGETGTTGVVYSVKDPNFLALEIKMGTKGAYSGTSYNYKSFYTPIRIAILQTPSLALRKNRVGINVNDNNLFGLAIATTDPKHFFVAQQFEEGSGLASINTTKDYVTLFNPSTQTFQVLHANGTSWEEVRYMDFINGIFK